MTGLLSRLLRVMDRRLGPVILVLDLRRAKYSVVDTLLIITVTLRDEFIVLVLQSVCEKWALRAKQGAWGPFWFEEKVA